MKLTVVGCAGSFPNATSPASCYLVEHDGFGLLLDLGSGSIGALAKYRDIDSIDAVALSHLHLDHCADLAALYVTRRYNPEGMGPRIPILGPPGIHKRIDEMYGSRGEESTADVFDFIEYADTSLQVGPFTLNVAPVRHCVPAYAIRVTADGRSLIYSGDTGPCEALTQLSGGADLGVYEASNVSTRDNPPDLHMSGRQAAHTAHQARLSRLMLTHFVAWNDTAAVLDEARNEFSGELIEARPGLELTI